MEVGVYGAGYVGLVTGACLTHIGHRCVVVENDLDKLSALEQGIPPIHEEHLPELLDNARETGMIRFTGSLSATEVADLDVVFIAVGTPSDANGNADLSAVKDVATAIGSALQISPMITGRKSRPLILVNKSTVPVGTTDLVAMYMEDAGADPRSFRVVSNPEFLRQGLAVHDWLWPDRVVIGARDQESFSKMVELYEPIFHRTFPKQPIRHLNGMRARPALVETDTASAELCKYAANAFLTMKISFINEVANISEEVGADIEDIALAIGLDERIGRRSMSAGLGWGGACFPKDIAALCAISREHMYEPVLLKACVSVNERQIERAIEKLQRSLHTLKGKRIALLGLSFKPGTDDLRGSLALEIAAVLDQLGAGITSYDPLVAEEALARAPYLNPKETPYEALKGAHGALLVTEWAELRELDLLEVSSVMRHPRVFVDGRNVIDPKAAAGARLLYRGIGR